MSEEDHGPASQKRGSGAVYPNYPDAPVEKAPGQKNSCSSNKGGRRHNAIDLPRSDLYVWNEHKFLECPEIVLSSRPCHRPQMSSLRGLVPR
jgi:hypothetical protein